MRIRTALGLARRLANRTYHAVPNYFGRSAYKLPDLRNLPGFAPAARRATDSGKSSLYYDRLFTLYAAVEEAKRRFGDHLSIAEVGVWKGGTSRFLLDIAPGSEFHAFDTFEGHDARDVRDDAEHRAGSFSNTSIEAVRALLPDATLHKGRFADTCKAIEDRSFHVVHLDVDIYEPMRHALRFFASRVERGGIIVVDDFGFLTCPGVERAVNEFRSNAFDFFPNLLTGQARLVRLG